MEYRSESVYAWDAVYKLESMSVSDAGFALKWA